MKTLSLAGRLSLALAALAAAASCGPPPPPPLPPMARFNAAMCAPLAPEDRSRPLDPNLEGVRADVALVNRTVTAASLLRLSVTFRNASQHGITLSLPQNTFTLSGFELVDSSCKRVPYNASPTSKMLGYRTSGPMPLAIGDSATIDAGLDDLAPGLVLPQGIYGIRLALAMDGGLASLRGRTVYSEWTLFAVAPPAPH